MKHPIILIFVICIVARPAYAQTSKPNGEIPREFFPVKFDEWGDIQFSDERARLDNAAMVMKKNLPGNIIYLVIYAGQTACVGEAKFRGIRAKRYLVRKLGVKPKQVVWIDGGHQQNLRTEVWIWPPDVEKRPSVSAELDLQPSEVQLEKKCKTKYRGHEHR